jgi:3-(3-hydroxy-phenyl)propionate hydroxylase
MVVDVLVKPEALDRLPDTNVQFCEVARPSSYIVGPGAHRRWEFTINDDETPAGIQQPESIRKLLSRWLEPHEYEIWRASTYRFHALVLKTWRHGNLFFLGDAAHMTPPFMAQGMCQGIRDASNLVWKLAMTIRGHASDALLDTYQQERLPHVRQTTLVTRELGKVICERDPGRAAVRDQRMLEEMAGASGPTIRQSLIPPLASGLLAPSDPLALRGTLFPQPLVENERGLVGLLDEFTGTTFRLVIAPGAEADALQQELGRFAGFPLVLVRLAEAGQEALGAHEFREKEGVLGAWFARHGCQVALVRPDHYVFGAAASAAGGASLLHELRRLLAAGADSTLAA